MASTFDETKKTKSDQSPSQSWFKHIGIEKLNNFSPQFFSAHRNTKTSSKSDDLTDLSTTDQGNGQDTGSDEDKSAEDPEPDIYPLWSGWNELCLVGCDKCDYFYADHAFKRHIEVRHLGPQDPSLYQYGLYQKKPKPTPVAEGNKGKKNGNKSGTTKAPVDQNTGLHIDDNKNNDSVSVNNIKPYDPGGQGKKMNPPHKKVSAKRKISSKGERYKRIKRSTVQESNEEHNSQNVTESVIEVLENCEETSIQIVTENSQEELDKRLEVKVPPNYAIAFQRRVSPDAHVSYCGNSQSKGLVTNQSTNSNIAFVNNIINSKAKDYSNSEQDTQSLVHNILFCNNSFKGGALPNDRISSKQILSNLTYVKPRLLPDFRECPKCRRSMENFVTKTGRSEVLTGTNDSSLSNIFQKNVESLPKKTRVNGIRNVVVVSKCGENVKLERSENNANLTNNECFVDGSKLLSRKTKHAVKLKSQLTRETEEKPRTEQFLPAIKLEPIKIKKALSSINRVCKPRTIEQFRTFSHFRGIMPSSKNSPHRTRVSCSVNTGAKSACFKSWNKVPFRYISRKCFFPLNGSLQAKSGLVLSDSPYKTLRATFNQEEHPTSPIQFQEFGFVANFIPPNQSTVEIEGFAALETNVNEEPQNGSLPSPIDSPWNPDLMNGGPDSGYLSQPSERDTEAKTEGSPISYNGSPGNCSPSYNHLDRKSNKPEYDSSQFIVFLEDCNKNGRNGIIQSYKNLESRNEGCTNR